MIWQVLLSAALISLALLSMRLFIRSHNGMSQYLVVMFSALAIVEVWATTWLVLGPANVYALPYQLGARLIWILLIIYPWALSRFASKASGYETRGGRIAAAAVLIPLAAFILFAPIGTPQSITPTYSAVITGFKIAVTLQFLIMSGIAAAKLWKASNVQPTIVSNRLRMMSFAAVLLGVALVIGQFGGTPTARPDWIEWLFGLTSLSAAAAFYICIAPPRVLRVYWSYSAVRAVRTVLRDIMQASTRKEAVTLALPIMAEVTGSDRVEAYDSEGTLISTWCAATPHIEPNPKSSKSIVIPMESEGEVVLHTSALWPFVGVEETDLVAYVASSVGLALNRRKLDEANARLQVQSAVEQSLRLQAKELEHANRELNEFVAVASHDLQTPVRNIIDNIEFLQEDIGDSELLNGEARQDLHYIESGAYRIKNLIDGLLHHTRVDAGERKETEDVDLNVVIAQAEISMAPSLEQVEARVTSEQLPAVQGNFSEFGELFINILENAYKYRSPERPLRIAIESTVRDNDTLEIYVSDNGIGIAPEFRERVFEMFKRLHRHEDIPGTGIGLAVCRKIVERMGGHISFIEPMMGVGATVKITVPRANLSTLKSVA